MLTRFFWRASLAFLVLSLGSSLSSSAQNALYGVGANSDFQLGFSYINPSLSPALSKATGTHLSAGANHSVSLRSGGTLWTWGKNDAGQLGDGTTIDRAAPVQIKGVSSFTAVAAGEAHSLALRSDGTVWAWGRNSEGQVGDGTNTNRNAPVQISGLTGIVAISAGWNHSLAVKSNGAVYAWGRNNEGQLGDTTNTNRNSPVLTNISGAANVAGGGFHSLILKTDGTVYASGKNDQGQIGNSTYDWKNSPVQVNSLSGVSKVSAGYEFSMALTTSNTIKAWGINNNGQLGANIGNYNYTSVQNTVGSGYVDIAAGSQIGMARKSDGSLYAWGSNYLGRVGDGTTTDRSQPVLISGVTNVAVLAPGNLFTLALKTDGTVYGWGDNADNKLALIGVLVQSKLPFYNSTSLDFTAIATGAYHTLALKSDGTVWAWGKNSDGQLGDGTTTSRGTPVQVTGLTGVTAISAGAYHSLARLNNGTVWAWGKNSDGQLGINSITSQSTPVQMLNVSGIAAIAAGGYHSLMLASNGTVYAVGGNWRGQLGNNSNYSQQNLPAAVANLSSVTAIAAGEAHSVALVSGGTVRNWGSNEFGQLGFGNTNDTNNPGQPSITGVASIGAGGSHTLVVKSDGTAWGWGHNRYGQIGNGFFYTTSPYTVWLPTQIGSLTGASKVTGGQFNTFVILTNETIYACGRNDVGQLGVGSTSDINVPTLVLNPLGVGQMTRTQQVSSGVGHTLLLRTLATAPALTTLSQNSATAGSASFTLTATGSGFSALDSELLWNGTPLANVSRSATSISATVPASYLAAVGTASITVGTPDDTVTGGYAQSDPLAFNIVAVSTPANPNLTLSVLSVKRNGTTVTVAFALTNRGGQTANAITVSASNLFLGSITGSLTTPPGTSAAVNAYVKGVATFANVPNTELQRFYVEGTYTYGSPTQTGRFGAFLRVKVP